MQSWIRASATDERLFDSVKICLGVKTELLEFLFDREVPRLNCGPDLLLLEARGLCSSDYFLVRLAIELWTGNIDRPVSLSEVLDQEPEVFAGVMRGLQQLRFGPMLPLQAPDQLREPGSA